MVIGLSTVLFAAVPQQSIQLLDHNRPHPVIFRLSKLFCKKFAVAETGKKLITFLQDETQANEAAGYLYGAEDVDSALAIIQKAWTAHEKALRIEYGKIAAPGTGSGDGPTYTRAQLDAMKYVERVKFANEHPDEYNKIMGR